MLTVTTNEWPVYFMRAKTQCLTKYEFMGNSDCMRNQSKTSSDDQTDIHNQKYIISKCRTTLRKCLQSVGHVKRLPTEHEREQNILTESQSTTLSCKLLTGTLREKGRPMENWISTRDNAVKRSGRAWKEVKVLVRGILEWKAFAGGICLTLDQNKKRKDDDNDTTQLYSLWGYSPARPNVLRQFQG